MRKAFETFSIGVLILLANAGVAIPYFFCLMLYTQHKADPVYALPFLMLYTFRCIGMLLTARIKISAATMLNVSSLLGVIGSLMMLFADKAIFGAIGGIILGLASSWIWPYFLTIRSRGKIDNEFSVTKNHSLSSFFALVILLVGSLFAEKMQMMNFAFILLAVLFVFSLLGGIYLKRSIGYYRDIQENLKLAKANDTIRDLVWVTIIALLIFSIRYSRLTNTSKSIDLLMCGLAAVVLGFLIYYQLDIHKKIFPLSLGALNRGVVMNFLLLYSAFDSTLRFNFNTMIMIFVVYLLGFELGPILLRKKVSLRYPLLLAGLLLTLFNWTPLYFFGLLLCSIFIGADNVILNQTLYNNPNLDGERAFVIKYQLSSVGNISQQLIYMAVIYLLSYFNNISVLSFFNASAKGASYGLLTSVHTGITLWIFVFSVLTYYFVRKVPNQAS
jgi:hypothetical protein